MTDGAMLMLYNEEAPDTATFIRVVSGSLDERIALASRIAAMLNRTEVLS